MCGAIKPKTYDRYRYFVTFLDRASRYLEVKLLRRKKEVYEAFLEFKSRAENNPKGYRIRIFATDNGGEYVNKRFQSLFKKEGITHQTTPAHTKEPNGLIERPNRTLMTKVRSLLFQAKLPNYLWGEALLAAVFLYNRTPHSALKGKTPYEMKNGSKPESDISTLRVFGSTTFYKVKGLDSHSKLKARARKAVLIGYTENAEVYKLWDIELRKVVYSKDLIKALSYPTGFISKDIAL